ncbi:YhhN-like protein [compost metagenome]
MIGAILFTISDSVLSWNMFVSDITHSGIYIMTTYYSAQFCIAYSLKTLGAQSLNINTQTHLNTSYKA